MKVTVFGHFVKTGQVGGAEHMLYNVIRGMTHHGAQVRLLCNDPAHLDPGFASDLLAQAGSTIVSSGVPGPRFFSEQWAWLRDRAPSDLALFPNYFTPPLRFKRPAPVATVIHDFQYRHFPQYFSAQKRAWLRLSHRLTLERADRVVVISENVRQDLLKFHGDRWSERVRVIPNPISWDRFPETDEPRPLGGHPYLLSVAAQYAHKNLDTLIRAFRLLADHHPDLHLVLIGQLRSRMVGIPKGGLDLEALISELGLERRIVLTGYLSDPQLGNYYRHASVFAFPSTFEGFGMPPVEAMGFGLPTLTTRSTSIPEVTLNQAQYVDDPLDAGEWAERLGAMLLNPGAYRIPADGVEALRKCYALSEIGQKYLRLADFSDYHVESG